MTQETNQKIIVENPPAPPRVASRGLCQRMARLFNSDSGRCLCVPLDDSLISGPTGWLEHPECFLPLLETVGVQAILGYPGIIQYLPPASRIAPILNLTASTSRSQHIRKRLIFTPDLAVQLGADAVAVHLNLSSEHEGNMLSYLAKVTAKAHAIGIPVLAICYPRHEAPTHDAENYIDLKKNDTPAYTQLVAHCVRVAAEIGVDVIKTQYTGSTTSFRKVIQAAMDVPVLIAGGHADDDVTGLRMAASAIEAGAKGISFGRRIFTHPNPRLYLLALAEVVHTNTSPEQALHILEGER